MSGYRVVDGADEVTWLLSAGAADTLGTGLMATGFEARALLLHAMWEHPDWKGSESNDEAHRSAIASGEIEPTIVGSVNLSDVTVATGMGGGATFMPKGWRRIRWRDLARWWGVDLVLDLSNNTISAFRPKLKSGSWPLGIQPPPESSLDWESLVRLVDLLKLPTGPQVVFNYSAPGAWYGPNSEAGSPPLAVGPLESMLDLYRDSGSFGSGQNWWPADHSWLVHTDWDCSDTVVQGPHR